MIRLRFLAALGMTCCFQEHLDFAIAESRDNKMHPSLKYAESPRMNA